MSDKNVGASVYARLKNLSKEKGLDMTALLRRYAQERLLYRLSVSEEAGNFCIKGGLLLSAYNGGDLLRPTEDIDFNGFDAGADVGVVENALRTILATDVPDDGVEFLPNSMTVKKDRVGVIPGGKISLQANVHTAKVDIRVDVGFGNPVTPDARMLSMPTLLEGIAPRPNVLAYPLETVIAEKFHAMVQFGMANTRLKDYYDIWMLSKTHDLDKDVLRDAIERTFKAQERDLPTDWPIEGLTDDFAEEHAVSWSAFLKRIDHRARLDLADVVGAIEETLAPCVTHQRAPNL